MENQGKNNIIKQKENLRKTSISKLLSSVESGMNIELIRNLFSSFLSYPECIEPTITFIQEHHLASLNFVLSAIDDNFSKQNPTGFSDDLQNMITNGIYNCISSNISSSSKLDVNVLKILILCGKIVHFFPSTIENLLDNISTNVHVITFLLIVVSEFGENEKYLEKVQPFLSSKLSMNNVSYGILSIMASFKDVIGIPSIKTISNFYKSISDQEILKLYTPLLIKLMNLRLSTNYVKEYSSIISLVLKVLTKGQSGLELFFDFMLNYIDIPESFAIIKPEFKKICTLVLNHIYSSNISETEIEDPNLYINTNVGDFFCVMVNKLSFLPYEYLISHIEQNTKEVILLTWYVANHVKEEFLNEQRLDQIIQSVPSNVSASTFQFLVHLSGFVAKKYLSKPAFSILVKGLDRDLKVASNLLLDKDLPYSIVFSNIARYFKPESEIFTQTMISLMKRHIQINDEIVFQNQQPEVATLTTSDSMYFDVGSIASISDDLNIETSPTDETILFCSVMSSLDNYPYLINLLPFAASVINSQFAKVLMNKLQIAKNKNDQFGELSAYGNALQFLDISTIASLAQTFLMLLPGQAMLYLAISFQRLTHSFVRSNLKKTIHFTSIDPDKSSKMIALISFSHPDLAIEFIASIYSSSIQKKTFLSFLNSESNEQMLILLFKTIGYCSTFMDMNFFIQSFQPFAIQFLNKYLTHQSKSKQLYKASLFAIKKLSYRLYKWQTSQQEGANTRYKDFPFKDFLLQYVCSYYSDVGDEILSASNDKKTSFDMIPLVLSTLSSLIKLRPLRLSDKHEHSIEYTSILLQIVSDDDFLILYDSTKLFFSTLLECNRSIQVFISMTLPLFPALLNHRQWEKIAELMHLICSKYDILNLNQNGDSLTKYISNIEQLISFVLPLTIHENFYQSSLDIIYYLVILQCKIKNYILSISQTKKQEMLVHNQSDSIDIACKFLEQNFGVSQIYNIILSLLSILEKNKILPIHRLGAVKSIKKLLSLRGKEDFKYDGKIVKYLVELSNKNEEIADEFVEIFHLLLEMRMFSVLSTFISQGNNLNDSLFSKFIESITQIDGGEQQLIQLIADSFSFEDCSYCQFVYRTIPLLYKSINNISNEVWIELFLGVSMKTNNIQDILMKSLVANAEYSSIFEFTKIISDLRSSSFQLLLSSMKSKPNIFFVMVSIGFASNSPEYCSEFLDFIVEYLKKEIIKDYKIFDDLRIVFESIDYNHWKDNIDNISYLLIQNLDKDQYVINCTASFINKIHDEDLQIIFWNKLNDKVSNDIDKWCITLSTLISNVKINLRVISSILPLIVVRANKIEYNNMLHIIGKEIGIKEIEDEESRKFCIRLMKSDPFLEMNECFLNVFINLLNGTEFVEESCLMIGELITNVSDKNSFVLNALIGQLTTASKPTKDFVIDTLMRLL